jgi:hypothetical protein
MRKGNMKKLVTVIVAVSCLAAYQAKAGILMNFGVGDLTDQTSTLVNDNAIALIVANTSGLGLAGGVNNLAGTSSLVVGTDLTIQGGGVGDLILGKANITASSGQTGYFGGTSGAWTLGLQGLAAGETVYVMWFPSLTMASTSPGAGTFYGALTNPGPLDSGQAWVIPADGQTTELDANNANEGGTYPNANLKANFQTVAVPEPSSILLVVTGLLGLLGLRRRS